MIDAQGGVESFNPAAERMLGYSAAEVIDQNVSMLMPSPYHGEHDAYISHFLTSGVKKVIGIGRDVVGLRRDGSTFPIELSVSETKTGNELKFTGIVRDVTERKRAEARIKEQVTLIDKARDAILVNDLQGYIQFWNNGAENLYGWTEAEALGKRFKDLLSDSTSVAQVEEARASLSVREEWSGELRQRDKEGREILVASRWTVIHDEAGNAKSILIINTDITEQKKLEALFYRNQRMESLGTLAGWIAHDLNNLLTPLLMSVQLLDMPLPAEQRAMILETVRSSVERGADLVRQVLTFARGVEGKREPVALKPLVEDLLKLLSSSAPKPIEMKTAIPEDLWTILGDATNIHQIMINLCVNAIDAMPAGGTLMIGAENHRPDPAVGRPNTETVSGPYVLITVTDSGTGIPPENLERIFDPFFTSKEVGSGTGLGLSIVAGIVKSHGGFVKVYSVVGEGTRFSVFLPATAVTAIGRNGEARSPQLQGHGELILVVDDEPSILQLAQRVLEANGYRTIVATNGAEAMELIARNRGEIQLVLTDMMMPKMDGASTICAIQQLDSQIRIIASSGLPVRAAAAEAVAGVCRFLSKPYEGHSLLAAVAKALGSSTISFS